MSNDLTHYFCPSCESEQDIDEVMNAPTFDGLFYCGCGWQGPFYELIPVASMIRKENH